MTKHTAIPWHESMLGVYSEGNRELAQFHPQPGSDGAALAQANARHAVRCVNSHDALVEALEDLIGVARKAIIRSGTDEEFADIRLEKAKSALSAAKVAP